MTEKSRRNDTRKTEVIVRGRSGSIGFALSVFLLIAFALLFAREIAAGNFEKPMFGFFLILIFLSFLLYKAITQFLIVEVRESGFTIRKPVLFFFNKANPKAFSEISFAEIKEIEIRKIIRQSRLVLHSHTGKELSNELFFPPFYFYSDLENFLKLKNIPVHFRQAN